MTGPMKNNNTKPIFDLDTQLKALAKAKIKVPEYLADQTTQIVYAKLEKKEQSLLPYMLGAVFLSNMLISVLIGGALYMMRPLTLFDWLIVGLIYSTINVFLYGLIFAYRKKIYVMLNSFS